MGSPIKVEGRLVCKMKEKWVINVRGADCSPEFEKEYNEWYNEVHVPMLLKSGELKEVTRFKKIGGDEDYPKYLVIYRFDNLEAFERYEKSEELAIAAKDSREKWPPRSVTSKRVQYELLKSWKG